MLKSLKSVFKNIPLEGMALMAIALPTIPTNLADQSQANLIIPQERLDNSFDVDRNSNTSEIQVPLDFIYMSQGFTAFHPGVDLVSKIGTPIKPLMSGTVIEAGFSSFGYGKNVLIQHENGLESLYAHLSKISVKKGDVVNLDSIIGFVGVTGHSTGPHLHMEVRKDGKNINPIILLPELNKTLRLITSVATQASLTLNQQ